MAADRGGFIFDLFSGGGINRSSPSIKRCPNQIDIVRFKALGHMGVTFEKEYYGDQISWWDLNSLGIKHGTSRVVKYTQLKAGWTYYFDGVANIFTVTDNNGNRIITKIKTLSDMGIVWEIFSSHQFKIYFSASFINDAFLIGWIKKKGYIYDEEGNIIQGEYDNSNCVQQKKSILAYVDQFFNETLHWKCNRFVKKQNNVPELENTIHQELAEVNKAEILRSNVPVRSATGDYTDMAIYSPNVKHALPTKQRNAIIDILLGEFLMIAFFASIHNMSKPVYEPWMLWGLWKWLCSSEPIETIDKIFDLSPRW